MEKCMQKGTPSAFRFITKLEGEEKYTEVGAAWALAKADTFSASVTVNGEKMKFLIVKNQPKPAAEATKPTPRKGKAAEQRPAA
jgi:hypothetical protein